MSTHHNLDIHSIPEKVLYINEPQIADDTLYGSIHDHEQKQEDNVRVYVPLDLNHDAIIRRMNQIGIRNGDPTEANEFYYSRDVQRIITQLEIYDQVWYVREKNYADSPEKPHHSLHAKKIVEDMLDIMEQWAENSSAECFPYEQIEELKGEYRITWEHFLK